MAELITILDDDIRRMLIEFIDDSEFYDQRLINAASLIDPPEYMRACRICNVPDGDHLDTCILEVISKVATEGI